MSEPAEIDIGEETKSFSDLKKDTNKEIKGVQGYTYADVPEVSAIEDISFFQSFVPNIKMMLVRDDLGKAEVIKNNFKDDPRFGGVFSDDYDNPMIVWNNKAYYVNKPGFSTTDFMTIVGEVAKYIPATKYVGRAKGLLQTIKRGLGAYPATEVGSQVIESALTPETEEKRASTIRSVPIPLLDADVDIDTMKARKVGTATGIDIGTDVVTPPVLKVAGKVVKGVTKPVIKPLKNLAELSFPRIKDSVALGVKSVKETMNERKLQKLAPDGKTFVRLNTRGQITQDPDILAQEGAMRGMDGEARRILTNFDKEQLQEIIQSARQLQEEFGTGDIDMLSDDIIVDTAEQIKNTIQEGTEQLKKEGVESYDVALGKKPLIFEEGNLVGGFGAPETVSNLILKPTGAMQMADELISVLKKESDNDPTYTKVQSLIKELEPIQRTGKLLKSDTNTLQVLNRFEKMLGRRIGQANKPDTLDEKRILTIAKNNLNDFIRDNVKAGIFEGDKVFLDELQKAKNLFYQAFQIQGKGLTESGTTKDAANKILKVIADDGLNNAETVNVLFGAKRFIPKKGLGQVIKTLENNLPEVERKKVMALLRDGFLEKAFTNNKTGEITRKAIAGQYRDVFVRNRDIAELLFSQDQLKNIQKFYNEVIPTLSAEMNINPSGSGFLVLNAMQRAGILNFGTAVPLLSEAAKGAAKLREQDRAIEAVRGYINSSNAPLLSGGIGAVLREQILPEDLDSDDPDIKEAEDVEVKPQSRLITPQQKIGDVNVTSPNIEISPPTTQEQPVQAASLPTSPSEGITSLNKGEQFEGLFPTDNLGRMIANRRS